MYDELNDLINSDSESQEKFASIKLRRKEAKEKDSKSALKRARITALILGMATIISLIVLLYAYVQKEAVELQMLKVEQLEEQLEECNSTN